MTLQSGAGTEGTQIRYRWTNPKDKGEHEGRGVMRRRIRKVLLLV